MSGFKEPDFLKRQEAAAIAKKAALEKFRAKATDPALADRLIERTARAATARQSRMPGRLKRLKQNLVRPNERSRRNLRPRRRRSALRLRAQSGNASWKPNGKWRRTLAMLPANHALNACNHSPSELTR